MRSSRSPPNARSRPNGAGAVCRRPQREQESDRMTREPAHRKLQHPSRRTVEPLDIVDRNQQRRRGGEGAEHRDGRRGDRALTGGCVAGAGPEERNLERLALRRRERRQDLRLDPVEQIRESGVRERRLHLRRCTRTAREARSARAVASPSRQSAVLPMPASPSSTHRGRPLLQGLEETAETLLLAVPAENDAGHCTESRPRTTFRESRRRSYVGKHPLRAHVPRAYRRANAVASDKEGTA